MESTSSSENKVCHRISHESTLVFARRPFKISSTLALRPSSGSFETGTSPIGQISSGGTLMCAFNASWVPKFCLHLGQTKPDADLML